MKKRFGFYAVPRHAMEFIVVEGVGPNEIQMEIRAEIEARKARQHYFLIPKDVKEALDQNRPGRKVVVCDWTGKAAGDEKTRKNP
jgi:hypothetical protein